MIDADAKVITHLKPPPEIDYPNRWVEERNLRTLHHKISPHSLTRNHGKPMTKTGEQLNVAN